MVLRRKYDVVLSVMQTTNTTSQLLESNAEALPQTDKSTTAITMDKVGVTWA